MPIGDNAFVLTKWQPCFDGPMGWYKVMPASPFRTSYAIGKR